MMTFDHDETPFDESPDGGVVAIGEAEIAEPTPFGGRGRRRRSLMAVVVLGGAAVVIGMRMFTGGPATAVADQALDNRIDGFLGASAKAERATLSDPSGLSALLDTSMDQWQVPLQDLRCNPFLAFDAGVAQGHQVGSDGMDASVSSRALQRRLDQMTVSMVMRGTVTVALVDGIRMPVGKQVSTEDGFSATLVAVGDHTLEVELKESSSELVLRGFVPIVSKDLKP
jgi:hypothetical protein